MAALRLAAPGSVGSSEAGVKRPAASQAYAGDEKDQQRDHGHGQLLHRRGCGQAFEDFVRRRLRVCPGL